MASRNTIPNRYRGVPLSPAHLRDYDYFPSPAEYLYASDLNSRPDLSEYEKHVLLTRAFPNLPRQRTPRRALNVGTAQQPPPLGSDDEDDGTDDEDGAAPSAAAPKKAISAAQRKTKAGTDGPGTLSGQSASYLREKTASQASAKRGSEDAVAGPSKKQRFNSAGIPPPGQDLMAVLETLSADSIRPSNQLAAATAPSMAAPLTQPASWPSPVAVGSGLGPRPSQGRVPAVHRDLSRVAMTNHAQQRAPGNQRPIAPDMVPSYPSGPFPAAPAAMTSRSGPPPSALSAPSWRRDCEYQRLMQAPGRTFSAVPGQPIAGPSAAHPLTPRYESQGYHVATPQPALYPRHDPRLPQHGGQSQRGTAEVNGAQHASRRACAGNLVDERHRSLHPREDKD